MGSYWFPTGNDPRAVHGPFSAPDGQYTVFETEDGKPLDDYPTVGDWETVCEEAEMLIASNVMDGWLVEHNHGRGFRLPGGRRTTVMSRDGSQRVIDVRPLDEEGKS